MKMRSRVFGSARAFLFAGALMPAFAMAQSTPPVSGDALSQNTPILNYLRNDVHAKMTSLGPIAGPGHDCVAFDINGKKNTGCLMPDGQHFVIGIVVDAQGHNVTLDALAHEELRLANAMKQAGALAEQSRQQGNLGDISQQQAASVSDAAHQPLKTDADDVSAVHIPGSTTPAAAPATVKPGEDPRWFASGLKPSELIEDVSNTASFVIGNKNAPEVIFVADPKCPFCHRAWAQLEPYVAAGKISVLVILVSEPQLNSEDAVTRLLSNPDINKVWSAGQGSKDNVEIEAKTPYNSRAWVSAKKLIPYNNAFLTKYAPRFGTPEKNGAPLLFYVGKKNPDQVYVREGVSTPDDMDSFLGGI